MGTARWNPEDWDDYVASTASTSTRDLFAKRMHAALDPAEITYRESCDSDLNPLSTPIIVAVDNTGSMGYLAETLIRKGLGLIIEEILLRKPVTDPHMMCMAVGDAWYDQAPLQVTQFETDMRLVEQLSKFYIEGGGGGNNFESYNLPWYFAATRTRCDAILKRHRKGYLFTVGDEPPPPMLSSAHARKFLNDNLQKDMSSKEILALASKDWEIFHIIIEEGNGCRFNMDNVKKPWRELLGQRAIGLSDHRDLAELIVSTIQVNEGTDLSTVAASWTGSTALVVKNSLKGLQRIATASGRGITRL
ncbi:MAG: hypothetical protein K2X27_27715, partial [Candidatus Obscuribacterales bacterium]|nr:hypothetical protein [Candidatus Obscuribacterales bacterium]